MLKFPSSQLSPNSRSQSIFLVSCIIYFENSQFSYFSTNHSSQALLTEGRSVGLDGLYSQVPGFCYNVTVSPAHVLSSYNMFNTHIYYIPNINFVLFSSEIVLVSSGVKYFTSYGMTVFIFL